VRPGSILNEIALSGDNIVLPKQECSFGPSFLRLRARPQTHYRFAPIRLSLTRVGATTYLNRWPAIAKSVSLEGPSHYVPWGSIPALWIFKVGCRNRYSSDPLLNSTGARFSSPSAPCAPNTNGHWDRPTCAQARVPIDEIVSGSAMSLFQASQAASMMAS